MPDRKKQLIESKDLQNRLTSLQEVHAATMNILEDFSEERNKLNDFQRALINILEDIEAERARTEQAKVLLESVNKELEAFSYSVSHDLRAPLRAIAGFSQAVMEDCAPKLDDEGRRYLGIIQENANKMGQLIDDLLAFSRLGRQVMTGTYINMEELAKTIYGELIVLNPERKIEFVVGPVPFAHGDKSLIRQVLMNLLSNAIKFTRTREQALIEFGFMDGPEKNVYYVRDNGVGFDMKYVSKLFGVFQRLHTMEEFEGTGVGLALVQRIIARHGGRVWAESKVEHGSTFYFTLS